jgi:hypothetical protein
MYALVANEGSQNHSRVPASHGRPDQHQYSEVVVDVVPAWDRHRLDVTKRSSHFRAQKRRAAIMLVRLSDTQQVNTDHVVNVATPDSSELDKVTISLSNGRQIITDANGAEALEMAMNGTPCPTDPQDGPTAFTSPQADVYPDDDGGV